ncbi:unnamed protein product, partial [marine sediment metagenome]
NGLAYRALRDCVALCRDAGQDALAEQCAEAADRLKAAYVPCLLNPKTGWLAGWRSRDGELHDAGYLYATGIAVSLGLIQPDQAREMMGKLEDARIEAGHTDFTY